MSKRDRRSRRQESTNPEADYRRSVEQLRPYSKPYSKKRKHEDQTNVGLAQRTPSKSLGSQMVDAGSETASHSERISEMVEAKLHGARGDMKNDLGDWKSTTILTIVGIAIASVIAVGVMIHEFNGSLKSDVQAMLSQFRTETQRTLDTLTVHDADRTRRIEKLEKRR